MIDVIFLATEADRQVHRECRDCGKNLSDEDICPDCGGNAAVYEL